MLFFASKALLSYFVNAECNFFGIIYSLSIAFFKERVYNNYNLCESKNTFLPGGFL